MQVVLRSFGGSCTPTLAYGHYSPRWLAALLRTIRETAGLRLNSRYHLLVQAAQMPSSLFFAWLVALALLADAAQAASPRALSAEQRRDREALLALKAAVSNFGTSKIRTWKGEGSACSPKPWQHVECSDDGRVISLTLSNLNIQATLPPKLRQLNALEKLRLDGNRFSGSLPNSWSDRRYFKNLQMLNLADNELTGLLPNRRWNKKKGFRELRELHLANNKFYGGLPDGWLASNKVFSKLKLLDLSGNRLGLMDADGTPSNKTSDWCLTAPSSIPDANKLGWCPSGTPLEGTMPDLAVLDLTGNQLQGKLPDKWPRMFPNLEGLMLSRNDLFSYSSEDDPLVGRPAGLPPEWTQPYAPAGFPSLLSLVLYPGNSYICNLPSVEGFSQQGFEDVNPDATYLITNEEGDEFDSATPWPCPGPDSNNAVEQPTLGLPAGATTIVVSWKAPPELEVVFGYKVTLYESSALDDYEEETTPSGWSGKLFRIYVDEDFTESDVIDQGLKLTSGGYEVDTKIPSKTGYRYRTEISVFNMNGEDSRPLEVEYSGGDSGISVGSGSGGSSSGGSGSGGSSSGGSGSGGSSSGGSTSGGTTSGGSSGGSTTTEPAAGDFSPTNTQLSLLQDTSLISWTFKPVSTSVWQQTSKFIVTVYEWSDASGQWQLRYSQSSMLSSDPYSTGYSMSASFGRIRGAKYRADVQAFLASGKGSNVASSQPVTFLFPDYRPFDVAVSKSYQASQPTVRVFWRVEQGWDPLLSTFRLTLKEAPAGGTPALVSGWDAQELTNAAQGTFLAKRLSGGRVEFDLDTGYAVPAGGRLYAVEVVSVDTSRVVSSAGTASAFVTV